MFIFYIICVLYVFLIAAFIYGISKEKHADPTLKTRNGIEFDILIPFKNEAKNLPLLLEALKNQTYNKSHFRLLFINDHSGDNSAEIIKKELASFPESILLNNRGFGKKSALISGFEEGTKPYVLTTDADCIPQANWILSHALTYSKSKAEMVIGHTKMPSSEKTIFKRLQQAEYQVISGITQGSLQIKHPIMCSGANLSFKRSEVENYGNVIKPQFNSGDDMFLLQYFKRKKGLIRGTAIQDSSVLVKTEALKKFITQRMRWAGKSGGFKDPDILISGTIILLANISLIILGFMLISGNMGLSVLMIFYGLKWFTDLILLLKSNRCSILSNIFIGTILFIVYPIYSITSLIGGTTKHYFSATKH